MRFRPLLVVLCIVLLVGATAAEAAEEPVDAVTPLLGLSFMVWVLVSVLLAANHPSISTTALVCWFLLFFPVSVVLFEGNVEVYLCIWYAYIALGFGKLLLMKRWIEPETRRFLLEWKGLTFLAVTLLAVVAKADAVGCVSGLGRLLHGFTAPEFVYLSGIVSCAVFTVAFFAYYLVTKHS